MQSEEEGHAFLLFATAFYALRVCFNSVVTWIFLREVYRTFAGPPGASIKELIAAIPTRRDALYESAVDWEAAEAAGVLESKIRPWLAKKIAEYLGEEEPTLVEFVMTKLAERLPPAKIEAEMVQVLDDDAEMFVVKLWRLLLFEVLRAGAES